MKVLFLGGDKRQVEIINHLKERGHNIDVIGYNQAVFSEDIIKLELEQVKIDEYNVVIFPVSGVKEDFSVVSDFNHDKIILKRDFLNGLNKKALVFTGIKTETLNEMLDVVQHDVIALMDDNDIKKQNSIPTVEGIIGDLIYNTDYTISGSNIFILGYGNVGRPLTEKLKALGADLTIGVIQYEEYKELTQNDINCIYTNNKFLMENVMSGSDIVINTVPELIINKDYLEALNKDAYVLDISSHPHGVDFDSANDLKIKNKLLLGIPGKVAPKTAGLILVNKIDSILERSKQ